MAQPHPLLGCSTITFRSMPLDAALETIRGLGFSEIDLGAIPSVVDHVPMPPTPQDRAALIDAVRTAGLGVRVVNADPGPLSDPDLDEADLQERVRALAELAAGLDAMLVVPGGAPGREPIRSLESDLDLLATRLGGCSEVADEYGVRLLVEAPHHFRLCHTLDRSRELLARLDHSIAGTVLDASHVVAAGKDAAAWARETEDRVEHVHLRDAVPGDINLSIGNGVTDFAALLRSLAEAGYGGHYALELETHDLDDDARPYATTAAGDQITDLLHH